MQAYLGAHNPREPLNTLDQGQRDAIYARLAERVAQWLDPIPAVPPRRTGPRFELAIMLHARRDYWEHRFSLPQAPDFARPALDCPTPEMLFRYPGYTVDGEDLFQLLFGSDVRQSGEILGAAFGGVPTADPTRYPLRVRLLTDDDRLCALPWATIAYQGRRLASDGWTVELHAASHAGFPEYPPHTCYFPGKVVLIGAGDAAQTPQGMAHLHDVQHFFHRHWQQAPEPVLVRTNTELRAALRTGSTRLVYYYGAASHDGLLLEGAERCFPWSELAELLQRSRSVSAVFLNLLGETSFSAISQGRVLLNGAMAVLLQCNEHLAATAAARAALDWLHSVFAASERLDPVVALHQHQHGQVAAWTHYASWQTIAPKRLEMPGLVNLLLDRRSQRAELSTAQHEFYTLKDRRIYQAVAFGTAGCRVTEFPAMASQHLRNNKREQEVILHRSFQIPAKLDTVQRVDDLVRQQLGIATRQSVLSALLGQETMRGTDFWFPVLGWVLQRPLEDAEAGVGLVRIIAEWCRTRLLQDMQASTQQANVRVISVLAMETASLDVADVLAARITDLTEELNREESFHLGELEALAGVRRQDLSNYFQDHQLCSCDDRYRREFPQLLIGEDAGRCRSTKRSAPSGAANPTTGAICLRSCAT